MSLTTCPLPEFEHLIALEHDKFFAALRDWINTNTNQRIYDNNTTTREAVKDILGRVERYAPVQLSEEDVFIIWLENRFPWEPDLPMWAKMLWDKYVLKVWQ